MTQKIDDGTIIKVTINDTDISSATIKNLIFKKPEDGKVIIRAASFFTDGTDGILTYTILESELDQVGTWQVQVQISITSGNFRSSISSFEVEANL